MWEVKACVLVNWKEKLSLNRWEKNKIKGKEESKVRYHEISRNENNSYQVYGCVNIQLNIL